MAVYKILDTRVYERMIEAESNDYCAENDVGTIFSPDQSQFTKNSTNQAGNG